MLKKWINVSKKYRTDNLAITIIISKNGKKFIKDSKYHKHYTIEPIINMKLEMDNKLLK